ncbi:MAG: phosphonopyruvate decarboxylase [Gammaproteobacteria bacterium]|nr:phosphonopyruvate decarboxylase [Gammaproteobacteria bacterium]
MISAEKFVDAVRGQGFGLWIGVPCSYLKPFINYVIDDPSQRYIAAANEGDAVAIAAGAQLGGVRSIAMFQNSGLGNAVNPLTSLTHSFRIPLLLIVTLRGEPGGVPDEPQHELMGEITTAMLELMQIPWEYFPDQESGIADCLQRAVAHMQESGTPYALVMRKGSVAPCSLRSQPQIKAPSAPAKAIPVGTPSERRSAYLRAVQAAAGEEALIIATTGYTGRELYALADRPNQLYMVGSMGCASSFGLGLALVRPERRVLVLDGDGAALMRMGAMSTIGYQRPDNLTHILLDNGCHESTGGQATVSRSVDFCAIATACGYPQSYRVDSAEALARRLRDRPGGLFFIHAPMVQGVPEDLPRPTITPVEVARRLHDFLEIRR